jgi:hypothetical protein
MSEIDKASTVNVASCIEKMAEHPDAVQRYGDQQSCATWDDVPAVGECRRRRVWIGAAARQKKAHYGRSTGTYRDMEGTPTVRRFCVDLGAGVNQVFNDGKVTCGAGNHQRGGAEARSGVDGYCTAFDQRSR